MPATYTQDMDARLDYVLKWGAKIATDDYITASTWSVSPANGLTADDPTFDVDEESTTVWLEGGSAGTTYTVTNHIVTNEGMEDDEVFYVAVVETGETSPALASSKICKVTGTFYDAGGNAMEGVYVRFTPTRDTEAFLTSGVIAAEVSASSDASGRLTLNLVRGVTGILAITGVGITKRVKVPNVGALDIKALVDNGEDLLEVQRPQFYKLPRRS